MRIFFLFIGLFIGISLQAQLEVKTELTTPSPGIGEKFKITYTLVFSGNGSVSSNTPTRYTPPKFTNFKVISESSGGSRWGLGQSDMVLAHYEVTLEALKQGVYKIAPVTFIFNNKTYESKEINVKVGAKKYVPSEAGVKDLFVTLELSSREVFQGEPIIASMHLYYRNGDFRKLEEMTFPEFNGFIKEEVTVDDTGKDKYLNGDTYTHHEVKRYILYPPRDGEFNIEPFNFIGVFRVVERNPRSRFNNYKNVLWEDQTPAYKIKVKPLPAGRPSNYIGEFADLKLKVLATPEELDVNQAITLSTVFSGNGNLKLLKELELNFPSDFEVYDPKVQNNYSLTASGFRGSKGYEYVILTRSAGDFKIPIEAPSYFDYERGEYKTLNVPELTFKVNKGDGSGNGNFTFDGKNEVNLLNQDVRYIKTNIDCLTYKNERFFGSAKFYSIMAFPFIAFLIVFFITQKRGSEMSDVIGTKRKRALKMAKTHLATAEDLKDSSDDQAFYLELSKALYGYVTDKFSLTNYELNKDTVRNELSTHLPESVLNDLIKTLETCDMARYAPVTSVSKQELFEQAQKVILESEGSFSE